MDNSAEEEAVAVSKKQQRKEETEIRRLQVQTLSNLGLPQADVGRILGIPLSTVRNDMRATGKSCENREMDYRNTVVTVLHYLASTYASDTKDEIAKRISKHWGPIRELIGIVRGVVAHSIHLQRSIPGLPSGYIKLLSALTGTQFGFAWMESYGAWHAFLHNLHAEGKRLPASMDGIRRELVSFASDYELHHRHRILLRYNASAIQAALDEMLKTLSPRDADVLRQRSGIGYTQPWKLEEIGRVYNITGERVRQIETEAMKKMRSLNCFGQLKAMLQRVGTLEKQAEELAHLNAALREEGEQATYLNPNLNKRVDGLDMSARTTNALTNANICYVGEVIQRSATNLLGKKGFGTRCLWELELVLTELDLSLNTELPGWKPPEEH